MRRLRYYYLGVYYYAMVNVRIMMVIISCTTISICYLIPIIQCCIIPVLTYLPYIGPSALPQSKPI